MTALIIDTDVALGVHHEGRPRDIDDGFAIVEAINSPEIDLQAVTTVFGNAPQIDVYRVAVEIVSLKQADIPVSPGAAEPLPADGALPVANEAVEQMVAVLRRQSCHIAAIGPLTNLGLLVHHHPEILDRVLSVVIVAGRSRDNEFFIGKAGPVRDFNFENDVRATRLLLESGVPVVLAGFELTSQVVVTEADLATIAAARSPAADYFHRNSLAWCRHWTGQFPVDAGFHPWDSAAISWLKHPHYFIAEQRGWQIRPVGKKHWLECDSDLPGARITYLSGFAPDGATAFVQDVVDHVF
ncbi:MAG: nucleoside hydrolase [Pseudomonadales bacterium]|nr:nucleoside hydrolase [Pseudomonadales bacterium]